MCARKSFVSAAAACSRAAYSESTGIARRWTGEKAPMSSPKTPLAVHCCWCRQRRVQILRATRLSPLSARKSDVLLSCPTGRLSSCNQHAATTPSQPYGHQGVLPVPWPASTHRAGYSVQPDHPRARRVGMPRPSARAAARRGGASPRRRPRIAYGLCRYACTDLAPRRT